MSISYSFLIIMRYNLNVLTLKHWDKAQTVMGHCDSQRAGDSFLHSADGCVLHRFTKETRNQHLVFIVPF